VKGLEQRTLAWTAVAVAAASFVACLVGWLTGGGVVDLPWAPTLGLRLDLALDGLGALYALLATGIGALVFAFGAAYLPWHLSHERRPGREARRFWPWMVLFMGSMVGLACSRDLVLLFVFFDLTAVASYFLIGFDRHRREARGAALMALVVTGASAVALLIGAVLLYVEYGTFSLPALFEPPRSSSLPPSRRAPRCHSTSGSRARWPLRRPCRRICTRPPWSLPGCS
jgi:multicomponent Na+:H+ antiporter subunit A